MKKLLKTTLLSTIGCLSMINAAWADTTHSFDFKTEMSVDKEWQKILTSTSDDVVLTVIISGASVGGGSEGNNNAGKVLNSSGKWGLAVNLGASSGHFDSNPGGSPEQLFYQFSAQALGGNDLAINVTLDEYQYAHPTDDTASTVILSGGTADEMTIISDAASQATATPDFALADDNLLTMTRGGTGDTFRIKNMTVTVAIAGGNALPVVVITPPGNGENYLVDEAIIISAASSDDTVKSIEFTVNDVTAFIDDEAPYSFEYDVIADEQSIVAIATNDLDEVTTSLAVVITGVEADANLPPVVEITTPDSVNEEMQVELSVTAVDPEGEDLNYEWQQISGTPVTLTNETSATATFEAPNVVEDSEFSFEVTVSDGENEVTESHTIMVTWVPQNLVVNIEASTVEGMLTLDASSSNDPDGYPLTFEWTKIYNSAMVGIDFSNPNGEITDLVVPEVSANTVVRISLEVSSGSRSETVTYNLTLEAKDDSSGGAINWLLMIIGFGALFARRKVSK